MRHESVSPSADSSYKKEMLLSAAIFIVALLVRAAPLGRYVTPDEPIWVLRSVQFLDALTSGDWAAIPQTGHPGLTTMALGALGVRIMTWLSPAEAAAHLDWLRSLAWLAPENGEAFPHLMFFLPAGRWLVMVVTSLGIVATYHVARLRLGSQAGRLLALFLALDPFFAGHAGLLHTDALQATFALLAVVLVIPRCGQDARGPEDRQVQKQINLGAIGASALCLALAGMTKTLGLLIAPGAALAFLLLAPLPIKQRLLTVTALTVLTVVCIMVIYPPFWSAPAEAISTLIGAVGYHEGAGNRPTFFLGDYHENPGGAFYPLVLLFRITPPVLLGCLLALRDRTKGKKLAVNAAWFLIPALLYLGALTIAEKKFDRYALSAIPLLTTIAALAWAQYSGTWRKVMLGALLLPWALVAPLPLYYATPLLGGPWTARPLVPLGWGENASITTLVAAQALEQPERATLLAGDLPAAASLFPGQTLPYKEESLPCADLVIGSETPPAPGYTRIAAPTFAGLPLETAYLRRTSYPEGLPLLLAGHIPGAPESAWIAPDTDLFRLRDWLKARLSPGQRFTWIHVPDCGAVTEAQLKMLLKNLTTCTPEDPIDGRSVETCTLERSMAEINVPPVLVNFGGTLDLVGLSVSPEARAGGSVDIGLRWMPTAPQSRLKATFTLEDAVGTVWKKSEVDVIDTRYWFPTTWKAGSYIEQQAELTLPLRLPPGVYTAVLRLTDENGQKVGVWTLYGTFRGVHLSLGEVTVLPGERSANDLGLDFEVSAEAPGLHLIGVTPPESPLWAGEQMPFQLGWERTAGEPSETLQWTLTCGGEVQDEGTLALAPGSPNQWPIGFRYRLYYAPRPDPSVPEGECELRVTPEHGTALLVGTVEVRQYARTFELPQSPRHPMRVEAASLGTLIGVDISEISASTLTVTLYWKATASSKEATTAFVHLIGPDGTLVAQSDHEPQNGEAPTSSWVPGQIILDTHTLALPAEMAPGRYNLFTGLYDTDSGLRFTFEWTSDQVFIGDIEVP